MNEQAAPSPMSGDEMVALTKQHTIYEWSVQSKVEVEPPTNYAVARLLKEGPWGGFGVIGASALRAIASGSSLEQELADVASSAGADGYYFLDRLWTLRGVLDRLAGGTGISRGRRDPHDVAVGNAIDFWRVIDARSAELAKPMERGGRKAQRLVRAEEAAP